MQFDNALDDGQAQAAPFFAGGRGHAVACLVEAVEEVRQIGRRDAAAVVLHRDLHARAPALCRQPHGTAGRRELERVVQQVGHRTLEELDIDLGHDPGRPGPLNLRLEAQRHATLGGARGKAHGDVVEHLAQVQPRGAQFEFWLVQQGQIAQRAHHAGGVARVAQRHGHQTAVVGVCAVALPAPLERLQAGDGGRERAAKVVAEVAHALAAEVVEPAKFVPLRMQPLQQAVEAVTQAAELVVGPGRLSAGQGCAGSEAGARRGGHFVAQHAQRPRHGHDDPGRQAAGQQHHGEHRGQRRQPQAAARQRPARGRRTAPAAHQVKVARGPVGAADDGAAQRARRHHGVGIHVLGVIAHHVGGALAVTRRRCLGRLLHRQQGDPKPRRQLGTPGAGQHRAPGVEQVELAVGLVEQQVAQEGAELLGVALMLVEQVVVDGQHAGEEGVGALVAVLVLEALEGHHHGGDHPQRRGQAGEEDRQREAKPDRHGASRIL